MDQHKQQAKNRESEDKNSTAVGGYFSQLKSYIPSSSCLFSSKASSINSSNDSSSFDSNDDLNNNDNYYMINSPNPVSIESTLSLISQTPVDLETIKHEFHIIHDYLDLTCHQFDHSRIVDQFASTHTKMGPELKLFIDFIYSRYGKISAWLTCMGLVMIAQKMLYTTPKEVKQQLLLFGIGRDFIYKMKQSLQLLNTIDTLDNGTKEEVCRVVLNNKRIKDLVTSICRDFASTASSEDQQQEYHHVVSLTTKLLY